MVVVKRSLSELINSYYLHQDSKLMKDIMWALENYSEEWEDLIYDLKLFAPRCVKLGGCPESKGCGKMPRKEVN